MLFAIMAILSSSVAFAMPKDVSAYKASQTGIPGFEDIHGKSRSVKIVMLNWAGNICLKTTVFTALCSKCYVSRRMIMGSRLKGKDRGRERRQPW